MNLLDYFTDPILRAPTIGSMLMCLSSSLVGVLVFVRKRSLLGEALSHASYPGIVLSVAIMANFFSFSENLISTSILIGAFLSAIGGLVAIDLLERKLKIKDDAALCFILSVFFGIGILVASRIQITNPLWYKQIQVFLFGQAATMTDVHIIIYVLLSVVVTAAIVGFYRIIEILNFDREFATTIGIPIKKVEFILFFLLVLAIVIGIRSVGVVLMSAMLIAPAVAARQFTDRLKSFFFLSAFFGMLSGFFGNFLSLEIPQVFSKYQIPFSLPTGPMIVLSASFFCIGSLIFAPKRGLFSRYLRASGFRNKCLRENVLKAFWKKKVQKLSHEEIANVDHLSFFSLQFLLFRMKIIGFVKIIEKKWVVLTPKGEKEAERIIRAHRLWEAYLVYLRQGKETVHASAEQMEHFITPEIARELSTLLGDPKLDPHHQPIPREK
ncbi:MAG: metal ABC transporter permease [Chlamydiae bacterium]|nr:metal ABC transporter permease [Chlamydiota bacterium]